MAGSRGEVIRKEGLDEYYVPDRGFGEYGQWDWAAPFAQDIQDEEIVQVRFKNRRRGFYINRSMLSLSRGDVVAVAALGGHDIGVVSLTGWLARRAYLKREGDGEDEGHAFDSLLEVHRKATAQDIARWEESIAREEETMLQARAIAERMHLQMKISDVEFQGDGNKAMFYYSAEQRVDFRELVRMLASEFKVRIEMRQIGPRQEAARIGGIGSCGRRLCCGGWLRRFSSVTTSIIKLQDLTPNPQKQGGQCGKLKCCLNFEVAAYEDAKRRMPRVKAPLQFEDGILYYVKSDLFRECMYFSTVPKSTDHLVMLTCSQVEQVLALNHSGRKAASLADFRMPEEEPEEGTQLGYGNVIEEGSLTRFDKAKKRPNKNKKPVKPVAPAAHPAQTSADTAPTADAAPPEGAPQQPAKHEERKNGERRNDPRKPHLNGGKPQQRQGQERAAAPQEKPQQEKNERRGQERRSQQPRPAQQGGEKQAHEARPQGERPAQQPNVAAPAEGVNGQPQEKQERQEKRKPFRKPFRGHGHHGAQKPSATPSATPKSES